jgi:hypothetical protein
MAGYEQSPLGIWVHTPVNGHFWPVIRLHPNTMNSQNQGIMIVVWHTPIISKLFKKHPSQHHTVSQLFKKITHQLFYKISGNFLLLIHIPKYHGNSKIVTLQHIRMILKVITSPVIPNYHEFFGTLVHSFSCFCHSFGVTYLIVRLIPGYYAIYCLTIMLYNTVEFRMVQ